MSKTSDWKIVATEGATVDGRKITAAWIKDMAETYSVDEYTALIWPEHYRSQWTSYAGKNWGTVEALKAEKRGGKLRLFAKITPNKYLLEANADAQKLFTSIEPNPDYKGEGRCYLMGLAVTDSPASTGTTRLKFSRNNESTELECSELEELSIDECFSSSERFFAMCRKFFSSGGDLPEQPGTEPEPEDEEPMNQEQFSQMMGKLDAIETKQNELETKQNELAEKQDKFSTQEPEKPESGSDKGGEGETSEQFSQLSEKLDSLISKQDSLETKFNALSQEVPGQEPGGEGADTTMEVF